MVVRSTPVVDPIVTAYLLKDDACSTSPEEPMMPVQVLIDLGSSLQVTRVPVIRQLILPHNVHHDCSAVLCLVPRV